MVGRVLRLRRAIASIAMLSVMNTLSNRERTIMAMAC